MRDQHWENLKEIFHGALACAPGDRAAYLDQATDGNRSLRLAVESLLRSHEQTNNFVDAPAYLAAAEMLDDNRQLTQGQIIGHYEIISLLGEGGMGTVYLAEDKKLHRKVSLKFLTSHFVKDQERLHRFEQEARAASALNHPNILTIHEISEADGHRFIATEFIEGQTLRDRLRTTLSVEDALEIATQIASALVAAHRVNIVHRDIKPENVMIRRDDGLVKVLDFGLAKVAPALRGEAVEHDATTQLRAITAPGVIMGTVAYMSPEQARGSTVDERTDIWSLGVVLYEMIAGCSPFIAPTSNEIISGILSKTPLPPLTRYARDVPERLSEIVEKLLEKNSDERYQTIKDVLIDLKRLRQFLEKAATAEPTTSKQNVESSNANQELNVTTRGATALQTHPASSAEYLVHQLQNHKRHMAVILGLLCFVGVIGITLYAWRMKHASAATPLGIKSLAVLPLRSLDVGENYLGVGIADAVIRRISQTGQLTVRPTSAVLKYVKEDTDSLSAARQLNADAILEGTVQHAGDRLRVTVNLLRTIDGFSLYTDSFDLTTADVFAIQDKVAQQVASRLSISFDSSKQDQLSAKYPTDPKAYEAYIRGITSLDERGYEGEAMQQMQTTIDYFKQSIAIDPKFVLSHAKLAFAYAWTAASIEPGKSQWAELAKEQIRQAQELDPNIAETHYAHAYLLWTGYEGYQTEAAIQELMLAKQLNPNSCSPDLPALLGHVGLDDLAGHELERALNIDPTSESLKDLKGILPYIRGDADTWFATRQHLTSGFARVAPWYYIRKGLLDDAQKAIDERLLKEPDSLELLMQQSLLLAVKGKSAEAETKVPAIVAKEEPNALSRHHLTYFAACVYALSGNSTEAVRWLKETAATGFPNFPLFERDPFLNRIRQSPEFVKFMSEQKAQWESYRQEFGG